MAEWERVTAATAEELASRDEAIGELVTSQGLEPTTPVAEVVSSLEQAEMLPEAVRALAMALGKREAVQWACLCVEAVGKEPEAPKPTDLERACLESARKWVADPVEPNRRGAGKLAEEAEYQTASACAALAAYLSGGSLAPEGLHEVPPADGLTGQAVAASVTLTAVTHKPEQAAERFKVILEQGRTVAQGQVPWPLNEMLEATDQGSGGDSSPSPPTEPGDSSWDDDTSKAPKIEPRRSGTRRRNDGWD